MAVIYDREKDILIYDRKLRNGPGNNMYGLEVCKSLDLPQDFLETANNLRMKYHPKSSSILSLKKTSYNSQMIKGMCEKCGKEFSSEVHHLQYQKDANDKGFIQTDMHIFHKDHSANLVNICKSCHDNIHKKNIKHKKVKTTKGMQLLEVI
jgi:DNA mismatch repair protein MutS